MSKTTKFTPLSETMELIKKRMSGVKYKIMVMSGKGGVGKSMVTANLAVALSLKGYKVAVLDADLHGPSIPKMLGVEGNTMYGGPMGIFPVLVKEGISVVSLDFMLPSEDTPVVWRGPLKSRAIMEFLSKVAWGHQDFLLTDLPPGTGDEPLSVAQFIPEISGTVIVTIPSLVSQHVVKKAISFAKKLNIPILGIVENMSYFRCPKCGEVYYIFGRNGGEKVAKEAGVDFLGSIPIDPLVAEASDKGVSFLVESPDSEVSKSFMRIADKILEKLGISDE